MNNNSNELSFYVIMRTKTNILDPYPSSCFICNSKVKLSLFSRTDCYSFIYLCIDLIMYLLIEGINFTFQDIHRL